MKLNALIGESRFIAGPGRPDAPLLLPPLEFGNVLPIELRAWRASVDGSLIAEDLSTYQISLLVGKSNSRAKLGFWQLATTEGTSFTIASRATNAEVQEGLRSAFGAVLVEGGAGSYIVTLVAPGVWDLPSATFYGNTPSSVVIAEISPGTASTPAQYRIEVLEVGPAKVNPGDWSAGNTTPVNTFTQTTGRLWSLVLSPLVDNGFFTLTVDGIQTDFVNFNGGPYGIAVALSAAGKPADVIPDGQGGYWVKFALNVAAASIGSNLVILPWSSGNLDLTASGVRELLDGEQFTDVKIALVLVKDGQVVAVASADAMLVMPVNQPDLPDVDNAFVPEDAPIQPPQAFVDYIAQFGYDPATQSPALQTPIISNAGITSLDFSLGGLVYGWMTTCANFVAAPIFSPIGNALGVATVNGLLSLFINHHADFEGGGLPTVHLTGGTNAAPTGQGITDKAALILAGWTVTTN